MLPEHIKRTLISNKTSIGENPCLPPDEEASFLYYLLDDHYNDLMKGESEVDMDALKRVITKLMAKCKDEESKSKEALIELANRVVYRIFDIPDDTINIELDLVDNVDSSDERTLPERTDDMEFDDIDDMNNLTSEIYKRRMLNCLVNGAAHYYAGQYKFYLEDLFSINENLPSLYKRLTELNDVLLFNEDKIKTDQKHDSGKVSVDVSVSLDPEADAAIPTIKCEGILLPILIEQGIKGILELAIAHGLPTNIKKADYVMKKADFKLAEIWDSRLGLPLWKCLLSKIEKAKVDLNKVGINFLFLALSTLEIDEFNTLMQEIFKGTKKGIKALSEIGNKIIKQKEQDDFVNYVTKNNQSMYPLNDDIGECFTADELNEKFFTPEELATTTHKSNRINEYLDKQTSDAMRSLGSESQPSQLSKDTYRSLRRDSRNPQNGITGIQKNAWLIHITSYDNAISILQNGFKSKVADLNFRATQDLDDEQGNLENGLCFAFEIDNTAWFNNVDWDDKDWAGIVFQANGFNAFSSFGDMSEVVFNATSAHNLSLLLPMSDDEIDEYLQYHPKSTGNFEKGVKLIGKNGRALFKGDIHDLMANHTFVPQVGYQHSPSKFENFLTNTLPQNKNQFNNKH